MPTKKKSKANKKEKLVTKKQAKEKRIKFTKFFDPVKNKKLLDSIESATTEEMIGKTILKHFKVYKPINIG